tara:strand:+ start:637 stop:912 length:276 start_codon:yes stop_codon:yes gene_type:complete
MKDFDRFIEEAAEKRCPPGKYYDGKKCSIPPRGFHVGRRGYIEPDDNDGENGKKNGNGNGSHNGNGNGNGNGGNGNGSGGNGGGGNGGGGE